MARLTAGGAAVLAKAKPLTIGAHEPYIKAQLRAYQCEGVNWLLAQYAVGTGGILGDEMGLGKTIQTLAFLSRLKAAGLPGPHLVVTPLAVLQNWANELKRFTPELSFVKIYGSASERDRLLHSAAVVQAEYDVYLTTYDTLRAEEAFFTEAFLFHTITIDEGHRLKNEASSLCASLARLPIPFRLLLTGTPLQNNLHELWALLSYILPGTLSSESFDGAARLQSRLMQLQKVCNHPKAIALTIDRDRAAAAAKHAAAAGSSFIKLPPMDSSHLSAAAREDEATLRALVGPSLIAASGKLAMLDRLLVRCKAAGSRALIFSQYTLSLDVLEEYVADRWGARGRAYFRLDGTTNRIAREMDMRSFNAPGSEAFLYLISTRAGGQGINLATADVVVLYDTCYNPQVDLQAQDRAHRIGQTKQVKIYRLISPSTFEERVLLRARQKLLLDALVIKKAGEGGAGVALLEAADEGDEGGDMGKLSVQELYRMLSHGADAVFDPTADLRPPPTAEEIDAMLDAAKPANVHDDLEEAGGEAAEELAEEGPQQAAQQAAPQPMHGYRCGRCGLPKKGHVCGAGVVGAAAPSVSAEARGEGSQPLTTAEDEWEPPPTTRSHAELVAEVKEHMATLGLTQKQFAQRVADADSPERSEKLLASLAEYLETCGGSAEMIIGWYTKTGWYNKQGATEGTTYSYFINTQGKRFRSRAEIARHFNLEAAPAKREYKWAETKAAEKAAAAEAKQVVKEEAHAAKTATKMTKMAWLWPREGDWIEVEVAVKEESPPKWVAAQVVVMLIDGMFQAQIVLPDGTDEWLDWFTWEEEGSDWRRAESETKTV
ncbi:swi snf matrix actin dependent regulator of subfamily member 5 [Chrysochromulina tobinii]|uniref:Swi snf matrix actin dependent regulator of subfamily member 5 n=1 Tax=Chrysochromulina tobinii TaxID=1460289 RepID=A0A0M0J7W3_9EUKA|nr:swi snf matrix actin dependent regulator of subfamily member 5 [Chrysochromulina tobinii]|eukprot:KOO22550.1 swi snf matrix actin dependent regulator of subfamily member 5 [Chrysochromulina sp. CCMP291]